jgi:phosphoribosylaminoimidazole (AIR) synthetase
MGKEKLINDIKRIVAEQGEFNINDVANEESPIISIIGKTNEVADTFNVSGVGTTIYVDETEIDNDFHIYEDLTEDVLEDILAVCESYETDNEKAFKRSQS